MNRALKCGNFTENVFPHLALHHLIIFQSLMANISLIIRAKKLKIEGLTNFNKFFYFGSQFVNNMIYYPTSLCRVQITPKTSTNITRYLYSRGPVSQVFSQRASDEFDSSYEKNFCLSKGKT